MNVSADYEKIRQKVHDYVFDHTKILHTKYKSHTVDTNPPIPRLLFQSWHTKKLPPKMRKCVDMLSKQNPDFQHFLFDDAECRQFIEQNYDTDVLHAYDHLIPAQYKCDLWKYCVLYFHGGIYIDIKYHCVGDFRLHQLLNREHFVMERPGFWRYDTYGIYNGLMVCKPKNRYMLACIKQIVENVRSRDKGFTEYYTTGSGLLGSIYVQDITKPHNLAKMRNFELFFNPKENDQIIYDNTLVLDKYPEYRREQEKTQIMEHYTTLWKTGHVFK